MDYNVDNFLLTYRVMAHATTHVAPSQLLMGRKLRTRLYLIHPRVKVNDDQNRAVIQERVHQSQKKQKAYHDRTARMREFEVGDHVWARNYNRRAPKFVRAKIHNKISPLSYRVFVRDGLIWRRHSQQLKSRFGARDQPVDSYEDDLPVPLLNRADDDETTVPETNAEEQNVPVQRRSVRVRRQPERLSYDVLGGQN